MSLKINLLEDFILVLLKGLSNVLKDLWWKDVESTIDHGTDKGLRLLHIMHDLQKKIIKDIGIVIYT